MIIDKELEQLLLDALDQAPETVLALTEETGYVGEGEATLLVDPLDGSFNAQVLYPAFAFSAALARGPHVGDIELAYVFDLATGDEFIAERGRGAWLNGSRLVPIEDPKAAKIIALESVEYDPQQLAALITALAERFGDFRTRILGSTALALCYAAAGRVEAVVSSGECRIIDFAAAQLIAREAGLSVGCFGKELDNLEFNLEREHRINVAMTATDLQVITAAIDEALPGPH